MYSKEPIPISELDYSNLNKNVLIHGEVLEQSLFNGTMFLNISDGNSSIKAIAFNAEEPLEYDKKYHIYGKVALYQKELEIIVKEIRYLP